MVALERQSNLENIHKIVSRLRNKGCITIGTQTDDFDSDKILNEQNNQVL